MENIRNNLLEINDVGVWWLCWYMWALDIFDIYKNSKIMKMMTNLAKYESNDFYILRLSSIYKAWATSQSAEVWIRCQRLVDVWGLIGAISQSVRWWSNGSFKLNINYLYLFPDHSIKILSPWIVDYLKLNRCNTVFKIKFKKDIFSVTLHSKVNIHCLKQRQKRVIVYILTF